MPSRIAPRGAGAGRGRGRGTALPLGGSAPNPNAPQIGAHVTTVGVKRPAFGVIGKSIPVYANCFPTMISDKIIHHYDIVIAPADKVLPARLNMDIITVLQKNVAPGVFTPPAVYDGRKNLFAIREILGGTLSQQFDVPIPSGAPGKPPKVFKITVTKVAEINPEVLARFKDGDQSNDNAVATALMVQLAFSVLLLLSIHQLLNTGFERRHPDGPQHQPPFQHSIVFHGQGNQGYWLWHHPLERILPVCPSRYWENAYQR
jgi:eukaryotic translation initiation factor 2C